jgi:hypothetical protein
MAEHRPAQTLLGSQPNNPCSVRRPVLHQVIIEQNIQKQTKVLSDDLRLPFYPEV